MKKNIKVDSCNLKRKSCKFKLKYESSLLILHQCCLHGACATVRCAYCVLVLDFDIMLKQ